MALGNTEKVVALTTLMLAALSLSASAEIVKAAVRNEKQIQLYWWPRISAPKNWHQDSEMSFYYNYAAFAPNTKNFANAETVMYANAIYKSRAPETPTMSSFIDADKARFKSKHPKLEIRRLNEISDADGQRLQIYGFAPELGKEGNWEAVAYGEEGDFFLVFTISSRKKLATKRISRHSYLLSAATKKVNYLTK